MIKAAYKPEQRARTAGDWKLLSSFHGCALAADGGADQPLHGEREAGSRRRRSGKQTSRGMANSGVEKEA